MFGVTVAAFENIHKHIVRESLAFFRLSITITVKQSLGHEKALVECTFRQNDEQI
jgi:hypothetical protein